MLPRWALTHFPRNLTFFSKNRELPSAGLALVSQEGRPLWQIPGWRPPPAPALLLASILWAPLMPSSVFFRFSCQDGILTLEPGHSHPGQSPLLHLPPWWLWLPYSWHGPLSLWALCQQGSPHRHSSIWLLSSPFFPGGPKLVPFPSVAC